MERIEQPNDYEVPKDSWTILYDSESNIGLIWLELAEDRYTITSPGILVVGTKQELENFIIEFELIKPEYAEDL